MRTAIAMWLATVGSVLSGETTMPTSEGRHLRGLVGMTVDGQYGVRPVTDHHPLYGEMRINGNKVGTLELGSGRSLVANIESDGTVIMGARGIIPAYPSLAPSKQHPMPLMQISAMQFSIPAIGPKHGQQHCFVDLSLSIAADACGNPYIDHCLVATPNIPGVHSCTYYADTHTMYANLTAVESTIGKFTGVYGYSVTAPSGKSTAKSFPKTEDVATVQMVEAWLQLRRHEQGPRDPRVNTRQTHGYAQLQQLTCPSPRDNGSRQTSEFGTSCAVKRPGAPELR